MLIVIFFRGRVERRAVSWRAGDRSRPALSGLCMARVARWREISSAFGDRDSSGSGRVSPLAARVCLAVPLDLSCRSRWRRDDMEWSAPPAKPVGLTQTVATRDSNDVEEQSDQGAAWRPGHRARRSGEPALDPEGGHGSGCGRRPGAALRAQRLLLLRRAQLVHLGGLRAAAADRQIPGRYRHQAQRDDLFLERGLPEQAEGRRRRAGWDLASPSIAWVSAHLDNGNLGAIDEAKITELWATSSRA